MHFVFTRAIADTNEVVTVGCYFLSEYFGMAIKVILLLHVLTILRETLHKAVALAQQRRRQGKLVENHVREIKRWVTNVSVPFARRVVRGEMWSSISGSVLEPTLVIPTITIFRNRYYP